MGASTLTNSRVAAESVGFVCAAMAGAARTSAAVAKRIERINTSTVNGTSTRRIERANRQGRTERATGKERTEGATGKSEPKERREWGAVCGRSFGSQFPP